MADLLSFIQNVIVYCCSIFSCIANIRRLENTTIHKQQWRTTGSTNPVETSMDMQPRSLPTYWYTSTRCYLANSYIGKSVHLLLGQTTYDKLDSWHINHILGFISPDFLSICLMNMTDLAIFQTWIWLRVGVGNFLFVYVLKTFSPRK